MNVNGVIITPMDNGEAKVVDLNGDVWYLNIEQAQQLYGHFDESHHQDCAGEEEPTRGLGAWR